MYLRLIPQALIVTVRAHHGIMVVDILHDDELTMSLAIFFLLDRAEQL